jgi:hypothetical protein
MSGPGSTSPPFRRSPRPAVIRLAGGPAVRVRIDRPLVNPGQSVLGPGQRPRGLGSFVRLAGGGERVEPPPPADRPDVFHAPGDSTNPRTGA